MTPKPLILGGTPPWFDYEREDGANESLARAVIDKCQSIEQKQRSIHEGHRRHAKLYAGYLPGGLSMGTTATANTRVPFEATKGLVRSICDTATALIVRTRPKAAFVTDGADWKIQRQAEDMEQFCTGAYERSDIYKVAPRAFHDSTWAGTGAWKYVERGSGDNFVVKAERCLIDDVVVEEEECREHLEPNTAYHRVPVRLDALITRYCSGDDELSKLRRSRLIAARGFKWATLMIPDDYVVLVTAYHLDHDTGKHRKVICSSGVVLKDEEWPWPWLPFTFLWWAPPITGFYGDGVAYRQFGRQQKITYMYRWIHRCHELLATPTAWVDPAGGPPTMHMSNEIGRIVQTRRPPVFQVHQVVAPEIYKWLDELERGGFEDEGISQVTANNRLPPGIDSAPAQREYSFKEGQRFAPMSQRWEDAVGVDPAVKMTAMYRRHMEGHKGKFSVKWADRKFIHQVDWPNLDEDAYLIRAEASNLDSLSPAARTQSALELAQTGWISPQEGRALVGHPDLRESDELGNAGETYAKMVLRRLYKGEDVILDEYSDLQSLDRIVRQGRLLAIERQAPSEIVDGMARFLDSLDAQKQKMAAAMAPPPLPAGAPAPSLAQGQGTPTPFSQG